MSDPALAPTDLGTFLGLQGIDTARAQICLTQAYSLCQSIVNPLPAGANAVVLNVAARAYMNPGNLSGENAAPFAANYGINAGGLRLTREDKRTLRNLNGGGGAFMIDALPQGVSSIQTVTITGSPTGGSFTISTVNGTTVSIAYNDTPQTVQNDFNAVPGLSGTTVTGVAGAWIVIFPAALGAYPQIGVASSSLTGGTSPAVTTGVTRPGANPPGANLPWWDQAVIGAIDGVGWPLGGQ